MSDRNFDDLADRFARNIYQGLKGEIRRAVLERDFAKHLPAGEMVQPWQVLDAGGGQGQMSSYFAKQGHSVTLCDISAKMLDLAKSQLAEHNNIRYIHSAIAELLPQECERYDLVACHAVLEWVDDPQALLAQCVALLKPQGVLSLTYYNRHGLIYKNLLRTNFKKIYRQDWKGKRGSLTPTHPIDPRECKQWLAALPLKTICESGIRVFHDYILNSEDRERDPQSIIELELAFSEQDPYRQLGRYIHVLLRKSS